MKSSSVNFLHNWQMKELMNKNAGTWYFFLKNSVIFHKTYNLKEKSHFTRYIALHFSQWVSRFLYLKQVYTIAYEFVTDSLLVGNSPSFGDHLSSRWCSNKNSIHWYSYLHCWVLSVRRPRLHFTADQQYRWSKLFFCWLLTSVRKSVKQ